MSAPAWETLPLIGFQDDGEGGWLELRNEPGGSTKSRRVLCACGERATWRGDDGVRRCDACDRAYSLSACEVCGEPIDAPPFALEEYDAGEHLKRAARRCTYCRDERDGRLLRAWLGRLYSAEGP